MKQRSTIALLAPTRPATELRRSITRMARLLGASMPKGELSPAKLSALGILRRDGPMTASALSSRLGIRPQSLTRILADVEGAELLIRTRDPRDSREHILTVTPKAVSLMRDEGVRRDRLMRQAMQQVLTPVEIELLLLSAKLLNKLADGWSSADAETDAEASR
jgi:DNA-binding MarR family transcriptional regulator